MTPVAGEEALPALEAVRIRRFGDAREYSIDNGLCLRADLAGLFEAGWVTITPDLVFRVSSRLQKQDGTDYEELDGATAHVPWRKKYRPLSESLWWHSEEKFVSD